MQITTQFLEVKLRHAREAHAQLLAQANAKAGEIQALEHLVAISAQPDPKPATQQDPAAPASQ